MKYLYPTDAFAQNPLLELLPKEGDIQRLQGSLVTLRTRLEKLQAMFAAQAEEGGVSYSAADDLVSKHSQTERLMLQVLVDQIDLYTKRNKKSGGER
jgi:hypothetical protein